jgi:hypothetical protein
MNTLQRLQRWYTAQCDGQWEHSQGISIETCDNPGWWVKIDIDGTQLQGCSFSPISRNVSSDGHPLDTDWVHCSVENGIWNGSGDETKLEEVLETFLDWAASWGVK